MRSNIQEMKIEKEEKRNGTEQYMNKMIQEKFPELKNLNLKLKEPISCSGKKTIGKKSRHTSLKFQNTREKEKILKASREGTKTGYLLTSCLRWTSDFLKSVP